MIKVFLFLSTLLTIKATAQSGFPVVKLAAGVSPDVEKVVRDFYNYFDNIRGEKIAEDQSTIEH